uniref:Transposase Helix-turn-helix domain-containing protein n=1 Tax=Anopheles arabiensis TaxID=7173 RepID=A0A182I5D0_ANOAR
MNTQMRLAISTKERLAIGLRFLATGCTYSDLQFVFRVSVSSISRIVPEVCDQIVKTPRDYV